MLRKKRWRSDARTFGSKQSAERFMSFARPKSKYPHLDRSKHCRVRKVGRTWRIQDYL